MKTTAIKITFHEDTGLYSAEEEWGGGLYGAFGKTPEEAMARLEFTKTLWDDCEECAAERAAQRDAKRATKRAGGKKRIDPYSH